MGPSPCPLGLNGVFWGSIIPRYLLMAGPVALESTKEKKYCNLDLTKKMFQNLTELV